MTQPYIESGDLVVIGLVQEQHPERAQLYAQWRELDWPIMWDPFNTTGALAVPNAYMIDEHGILQGKRLSEESLAAFMEAVFEAPDQQPPVSDHPNPRRLFQTPIDLPDDFRDPEKFAMSMYWQLLSDAIWHNNDRARLAGSLRLMLYLFNDDKAFEPEPIGYFRLGVLYRMKYDSSMRSPSDFQHAIDAWERALERDPNQYIWRRRIQQYGPMSDKPYPFYDWVETAQREITERGETPVAIPQALTQAELATRGSALVPEGESVNPDPDPDAHITVDDTGIVTITSATTPDTQRPGSRRVLIEFTTSGGDDSGGHWNNEAEPLTVWIDAESLPEGWSVESPLLVHASVEAASSDEPRIIDFGLTHPPEAAGRHTFRGYALYNVCEAGDLGQCLYRRQAFEVWVVLD